MRRIVAGRRSSSSLSLVATLSRRAGRKRVYSRAISGIGRGDLSPLRCECRQRRHLAIVSEFAHAWQIIVGLVVDDGVFQNEKVTTFHGNARWRPWYLCS